MKAEHIFTCLKKKFRVSSDVQLSEKLGFSNAAMSTWRNNGVNARQIANIINKAYIAGSVSAYRSAIKPLVEFYPIEKHKSSQSPKFNVFRVKDENGKEHPYKKDLRDELKKSKGVYVFFDSRGQAIYVGRTVRQNLWDEIYSAFNRDRGIVQKINKVAHPKQLRNYKTSDEKDRKITSFYVPLHDLAAYFSAYTVKDEMIRDIEAMLIRCFANDLLNTKKETFSNGKKIAV